MKVIFFILFIVLFLLILLPVGLLCIDWGHIPSIICFIGLQIIGLGLCYDLTELILTLFLKKQKLPKVDEISKFPKVALLYTTCNDAMEDCLSELRNQIYPNYDIFILDDSTDKKYREIINRYEYKILRRDTRKGYKAGNLNNWLLKYSNQYKYFVILDSDSKIKPNFMEEMVKYAEHPMNSDIAIFQSKILPWNSNNRFSKIAGILTRSRMHIMERVSSRLDMLFSFGHNNLHGTLAIKAAGGFNELITPEDTAITLSLSEMGLKCKLVDVISYDTEPSNIFSYTKRIIRWGKQTIEVFRIPWSYSSLSLKIVLCRHILSYIVNLVYPVLMFLSIWGFDTNLQKFRFALSYIFNNQLYLYFALCLSPLFLMIANILLNLVITTKCKISISKYAKHSLLSGVVIHYFWFSLGKELLKSILGGKTVFNPTNSYGVDSTTFYSLLIRMKPTLLLSIVILVGLIINPISLFFNFNFIWIPFLVFSPALIWFFHKEYR